ncbi:protease complex subunit PrcB family protein [Paenibacillus sp. TRM 82003]|nr:protease complex subunit PrcB family protein [Paenibacillus sp. TRM 82003]
MKTVTKCLAAALSFTLLVGAAAPGAQAFQDLTDVPGADRILELRERGIVSGLDRETFAPHQRLAAEQAIPLLVKAFELNLDRFRFMKPPLASDYFDNVPDDAWYAEAFIIAHLNGIPIEPDTDPNADVSRQTFMHWLMGAVLSTGDYPVKKMIVPVADDADIDPEYRHPIQLALLAGIAELDEEESFDPRRTTTRAEAAMWVYKALRYIEAHQTPAPAEAEDVETAAVKLNDELQRVTLSWGEKPHAGWSIRIEGIDFVGRAEAVVRYSLGFPDPAAFYAQVVTNPKASTVLGAAYTDIRYERVDAATFEWHTPSNK